MRPNTRFLRDRLAARVWRRGPPAHSLDAALYVFMNRLPHTAVVDEYVELVSDMGKGAGWVTGCAITALRGQKRDRLAAMAATAAMFSAIGLAQGPGKALFHRRRPWASRVANVVGPRTSDFSFPSGHTAGSFAAATALGSFYPKSLPWFLGAAVGVGASRVYLGHHFPSDVLAGAALGAAVGGLFGRLFQARPGQVVHDLAAAEGSFAPTRPDGDATGAPGSPSAVPDGGRALVQAE